MTTIDKGRFSQAVKRFRKQNDLTQRELAQKLMTTVTTVARWELGMVAPKSERMLEALKVLGVRW